MPLRDRRSSGNDRQLTSASVASQGVLTAGSFRAVLARERWHAARTASDLCLCVLESLGPKDATVLARLSQLLPLAGQAGEPSHSANGAVPGARASTRAIGWLPGDRLGILLAGDRAEAEGLLRHLAELGLEHLEGRVELLAHRPTPSGPKEGAGNGRVARPPVSRGPLANGSAPQERTWSLPISW